MGMGILKREKETFCTEASLGDARQHQDFTELHGESDDPGGFLGAANPSVLRIWIDIWILYMLYIVYIQRLKS